MSRMEALFYWPRRLYKGEPARIVTSEVRLAASNLFITMPLKKSASKKAFVSNLKA